MTNHQALLRPARSFNLLLASFILILCSATTLLAQRPPRPAEQRARANQVALNEWRRTHMREELDKQLQKKRISLMPQIKEDFTRIQVANNAMMHKVFNDEVLDYREVSERLAEIRKRAQRLKENLMLPEMADGEVIQKRPGQPVGATVRDSLLALDTLIMEFVRNPLFQKPGVIDAKLSAQAGRDLKTIVERSGGIKKEIEKLAKLQVRP